MNNLHQLKISSTRYPGGLRIVECDTCRYAFAAEFDAQGIIKLETRVGINPGDAHATHSMFQTPQIELNLRFGADVETDDRQAHFGEL